MLICDCSNPNGILQLPRASHSTNMSVGFNSIWENQDIPEFIHTQKKASMVDLNAVQVDYQGFQKFWISHYSISYATTSFESRGQGMKAYILKKKYQGVCWKVKRMMIRYANQDFMLQTPLEYKNVISPGTTSLLVYSSQHLRDESCIPSREEQETGKLFIAELRHSVSSSIWRFIMYSSSAPYFDVHSSTILRVGNSRR